MRIEHWDEGQSWSCLPHAVAGFVGAFILQSQGMAAWSFVPFAVGTAFLVCRSGCSWDADQREFRSYTGWKVFGKHWTWGRRVKLPPTAEFRLNRTKETMMNRRGAANAVKIDSWELQWSKPEGAWRPLHDFTNRHLAQRVLQNIQGSLA